MVLAVAGTHVVYAQDAPGPLASAVPVPPAASVTAGPTAPVPAGDSAADSTALQIVAGRSTIVDTGHPIARVSLTSADVADALVTSPSQLLVHGKVPGTISMFVWNRDGGITRYEVAVQRDVTRLSDQMKQLLPGEPIEVRNNGKYVVISGKVSSKEVIERATNLASGFVDKKEDVVTLLQIQEARPTNQVLLRVRFAEVSRTALTEFGLSFFTSPTGVENTLGRVTTQQFGAPGFNELQWSKNSSDFGAPVTSAEGKFTFSDFLNFFILSERYDLGTMIRALQTRGLFQSLAEPNLVAESGKEASFLAGGEFPIPIVQGTGGNMGITVQFKEFGIRLNFTPTVTGDRVHLKVRPEVSTLDFANAVILQGFRIPALSTRRTETELELRDGQTFAIAGLLNNRMNSTMQKIPGIGDIPILGYLFRSKAAQKDQTELVVMITPQILTNTSNGVTGELPRLQEPYLPQLPANRTQPPPPPAFQGPAQAR
jgi:pilus assembly protein CpaC